eukprot:15455046-Alexandrium_andersonii.AAC.1
MEAAANCLQRCSAGRCVNLHAGHAFVYALWPEAMAAITFKCLKAPEHVKWPHWGQESMSRWE